MAGLLTDVPDLLTAGGLAGWVAALVVLVRSLVAWRKGRADVRSQDTDTDKALAEAAVALVDPLRGQITYLGGELAATRAENQQLRREVEALRGELARVLAQLAAITAAPPSPVQVNVHTEETPRSN